MVGYTVEELLKIMIENQKKQIELLEKILEEQEKIRSSSEDESCLEDIRYELRDVIRPKLDDIKDAISNR